MKRIMALGLFFLPSLFLAGCYQPRHPTDMTDPSRETWMREVDTNPNAWLRGADNWFVSGYPNATEVSNRNAPMSAAISTMNVRVPSFHDIRINGDFQVQLIGVNGPNSVFVYGPNDGVRDVVVEVQGNTLCLSQVKNARHIRQVIIRIGVNDIANLTQLGCGPVEGVGLHSVEMNITSSGPGNIYLGGPINLRHVLNRGAGNINVFGARTFNTEILTASSGSVNISGDVNLRTIIHHGRANINIIGAHSSALRIRADGSGKIGILGSNINLQNLVAKDFVSVYAYNINSPSLYSYAHGKARIGLAGHVANLYSDTYAGAQFDGRLLCAQNAYVRARDWSHTNIAASNKMFTAATQNATVYFYGSPGVMTQFVSGNGVVLPIFNRGLANCSVAFEKPYVRKTTEINPAPITMTAPIDLSINRSASRRSSGSARTYVPRVTSEVPFSSSTRTSAKTTVKQQKVVGQG